MTDDAAALDMDKMRRAWSDANVVPLWETSVHRAERSALTGRIWRWRELRPLIEAAVAVTDTAQAERRVLALADPHSTAGRRTVTNLNANLQILMPGETARPHRHTPSALRFVLEGAGGVTIVDGKPCPMEVGDLVITPALSWHEHRHDGTAPLIWLDALDVALHQYLGAAIYEPGPPHDLPPPMHDAAYAWNGMRPAENSSERSYSPIFRFARETWTAALATMPVGGDGSRRLRFVNPRDGGPILPLMDCSMLALRRGLTTSPSRSVSNAVALAVNGEGRTRVGENTFAWGRNDIITLPGGNWIEHTCESDDATLFIISDREIYRRLGLLQDERAGSTDSP
jgi:gentisate 1,2-dioxygenase